MLNLLLLPSIATADWGPFPVEEQSLLEDTAIQEIHSPCSQTRMLSGEPLQENKEIYKLWHPKNTWATLRMVDALTQAAEDVHQNVPEADPLVIGDISKEGGGKLDGHKSHQGGSDADIGIYWGDAKQHLIGFMNVNSVDFDSETNWILIRSLLESGEVERVLVDQALVNELRKYVIRSGEMTREEAYYTFPQKMSNHPRQRSRQVQLG
jgi:hypothetical protein